MILTGRVADGLDSAATSIVDEDVVSSFNVWVKLKFNNVAAGTVNVEPDGGGAPFTEGAANDYIIDYLQGMIMVLSTGTMADATHYDVDYDYTDGSLAVKVNAVTSAAQAAGKAIYEVATTRLSERMGVAVIVYQQ